MNNQASDNILQHPGKHSQPDSHTLQSPQAHESGSGGAAWDSCTLPPDNQPPSSGGNRDLRFAANADGVIESVTSELSSELIGDIRSYVDSPDVTDSIRKVPRAEFLPYLFRLRGKPYSLKDRELFNVMYDNEYVPETVFMSARQLGKSLNLSRSEVLDAISVPELQLLYVAPLQSQTQRYSTLYLNEAIQSCELARQLQAKSLEGMLSDSKIVTQIGHQSFANGSGIQLTYAKTSPDRARGIFADRIDFDEIQDQLVDNIPIIAESLTASKWGIRKYTGTAKTIDNTIEHFWQLSSKCEWVMKCEHCGAWNIPNMEGRILDMIQADGVHCVYCGGRLNTRLGEWVPEHPDRMHDFRGYHVPQIVMPAIAEDPESWSKIVRKVLRQPLSIFLQESLGISHSVGSRLITEADIRKQCVLPSTEELKQWKKRYAHVVAGVDWGGAEQSSFTVLVVVGIRSDGRIDVLWAKRYIGFDPDDQFIDIAQTFRFYGCEACLDEDALVLTKTDFTSPCYKRIIDITTMDRVWDGHAWVRHDGVKLMRYVNDNELKTIRNTRLTGDHRVYISDTEARRADSLSGEGCASAMAWRQSTSPVSAWHNVWLLTLALGRSVANLVGEAIRKAKRKVTR